MTSRVEKCRVEHIEFRVRMPTTQSGVTFFERRPNLSTTLVHLDNELTTQISPCCLKSQSVTVIRYSPNDDKG